MAKKYESTQRRQKQLAVCQYRAYPSERKFAVLVVHCMKIKNKRARIVKEIVNEWIDKHVPKSVQEQYWEIYKTLTVEQIKKAGTEEE